MPADVEHTAVDRPADSQSIYVQVQADERLFQGEVVERVLEWIPKYADTNQDEVIGAEPRLHRLAIVITQECDLAQDWEKRSANSAIVTDLPNVLFCAAGAAEELRSAQNLHNKLWTPIRSNKNERYQYLAEIPKDLDRAGEGHVAILLDFKSIFAVRTVEIYRQLRSTGENAPRRRCKLATPWAEHLQCRFAAFHARIGLPRDHFIPEIRRVEGAAPE